MTWLQDYKSIKTTNNNIKYAFIIDVLVVQVNILYNILAFWCQFLENTTYYQIYFSNNKALSLHPVSL